MTAQTLGHRAEPAPFKSKRSIEYRLLYLATFPVFLVATALGRMLPLGGRGAGRRSVLDEAKAAAATAVAFAFMG